MPCSMTAAAASDETPSGTLTRTAAGAATASAYDPGALAQATRSPSRRPETADPSAVTTPAPSRPGT